ncbi:hypothetical protein Dsin_012106 [Dipteronia sinensis]|uniref:Uncharacterized protein n=1 Tax=Dipteronia sinensis TaxID=43782 RepID=A0AAE0E7Q2_9ROSI|nr:hypothetical protein Dsin_012106 [Dipteronia sinensis]
MVEPKLDDRKSNYLEMDRGYGGVDSDARSSATGSTTSAAAASVAAFSSSFPYVSSPLLRLFSASSA